MSLLLLFSCVDWSEYNVDRVDTNPSIALPLINGSISLSDLLEKADSSIIKVYSDGLVYFSYSTELETRAIGDLFAVPNKTTNISFILPGATYPSIPNDLKTDSISRTIDFAMDPERIDEIGLVAGEMAYVTSSSSPTLDYEIKVSIPGFVSSTPAPLNVAVKGNNTVSLNNYKLLLDDNKFQIKVTLILKKRSTPLVVPPGTAVNVQLSFKSFQFRYLKGFLGEQISEFPETSLEMQDFGSLFNGAEISLAQPKLSLTITNEYGVPLTGNFPILEARKEGSQPLKILWSPAGPLAINYPSTMGGTGAVTTASFTNLNEILEYAPSSIHFQATGTLNKGLADGVNFVIDTSTTKMRLDVEVPLFGHASGINLRDTVDIDLSQSAQSEITKAALRLKIRNELPLDGLVQFFLVDENYKVLDVLLDDKQMAVLRGSQVNAGGELVTAGLYDGMIELDQEKIDKVFQASRIIIVLDIQTSRNASGGPQNVKFKAGYTVAIEAGILADLKLKIQ